MNYSPACIIKWKNQGKLTYDMMIEAYDKYYTGRLDSAPTKISDINDFFDKNISRDRAHELSIKFTTEDYPGIHTFIDSITMYKLTKKIILSE